MYEYAILHFRWEECESFHSAERCTHSLAEETLSAWGLHGWAVLSISVRPEFGLYYTLERVFEIDDEGDSPEEPPTDPDGERAIRAAGDILQQKESHAHG